MIVTRLHNRLGNQLFQYWAGRILAERIGDGFVCTPHCENPDPMAYLPMVAGGRRPDAPPLLVVTDIGHENFRPVDWAAVERQIVESRANAYLFGFYQQVARFMPYREQIAQALPAGCMGPEDPARDTVLHVRLEDHVSMGWTLPPSYYLRALEEIQPTHLTIVTDEPKHRYLRHFARWRPEITDGLDAQYGPGLWGMLGLIGAHRHIVLGNSTLAWWAAFLAKPKGRDVWLPHNFQPYGRAQPGDQHKLPGEAYLTDLRVPGWHVVDMQGTAAYDLAADS